MDPNDLLRNLFRGFFGFPRHQDDWSRSNNYCINEGRKLREDDDETDSDPHSHENPETNPRGFTVYTDPLELHKYFDQQMDEMLQMFGQSFGFGGLGNRDGLSEGFGVFTPSHRRMVPYEDHVEEPAVPDDHARDFMLREEPGQPRVDTEVDWDKLDREEIDRLMTRESGDNERSFRSPVMDLFPAHRGAGQKTPGSGFSFQSFGSSVSERSVTRPNGGVETTRTVRTSDGSEEVTVTRRLGDQAHEQVTRRDKAGATVTEENLVNIQEADLERFNKSFDTGRHNSPRIQEDNARDKMVRPPSRGLWDTFFGN